MKKIGKGNNGETIVELTPDEYKALGMLSNVAEGLPIIAHFQITRGVYMEGDIAPWIKAVYEYCGNLEVLRLVHESLTSLISNLEANKTEEDEPGPIETLSEIFDLATEETGPLANKIIRIAGLAHPFYQKYARRTLNPETVQALIEIHQLATSEDRDDPETKLEKIAHKAQVVLRL